MIICIICSEFAPVTKLLEMENFILFKYFAEMGVENR